MDNSLETEESNWEKIFKAIKRGDIRKTESLLNSDPSLIYNKTPDGNNVLHLAAEEGHVEIVRMLIQINFLLTDDLKQDGCTASYWESRGNNCKEIDKTLLTKAPDLINSVNNYGWTALHWASQDDHQGVVWILFHEAPHLLNFVTRQGSTALHLAASNGHDRLVKMLFKKNPSMIEAVDIEGNNAWNLAVNNGHKIVAHINKSL